MCNWGEGYLWCGGSQSAFFGLWQFLGHVQEAPAAKKPAGKQAKTASKKTPGKTSKPGKKKWYASQKNLYVSPLKIEVKHGFSSDWHISPSCQAFMSLEEACLRQSLQEFLCFTSGYKQRIQSIGTSKQAEGMKDVLMLSQAWEGAYCTPKGSDIVFAIPCYSTRLTQATHGCSFNVL